MTLRVEARHLLEQIDHTFMFLRCPEPGELVDGTPGDIERQEIRSEFSGKPWPELPPALLLQRPEALFFFTPKAWAYYVPAFMKLMLLQFKDAEMVVEMFVGSLARHSGDYLTYLTPGQRQTIVEMLSWLSPRLHDRPQKRREVSDVLRSLNAINGGLRDDTTP